MPRPPGTSSGLVCLFHVFIMIKSLKRFWARLHGVQDWEMTEQEEMFIPASQRCLYLANNTAALARWLDENCPLDDTVPF